MRHKLYMTNALPSLFQSGISLLDTPGVGESESVTQVLLDYVQKHDVFGFIFVIKCDDAGGILPRVCC